MMKSPHDTVHLFYDAVALLSRANAIKPKAARSLNPEITVAVNIEVSLAIKLIAVSR